LVCAAHQVVYSRAAPEVSVHLAVDAARALGDARAAGLVNAVLRRFVRESAAVLERIDRDCAAASAHPEWFVQAVRSAWPANADAVLRANNEHPPMTLRVDLTRGTVAQYLHELAASGRAAQAIEWRPGAVQLERATRVTEIPGFLDGRVSVQDVGAQLAAPLLAPAGARRVLDACAAPGGKTLHLLELAGEGIELVAADVSARRLAQVEQNLSRAGRKARCVVADLSAAPDDELRGPFDRILLDVPCSSTGVIRRHPDIKLLRRASDLGKLASTQLAILERAFGMLGVGGRLLYATCSVLPEENECVVAAFLERQAAARLASWPQDVALPPGAIPRRLGVQLLPGTTAGSDGFYYACLERS
jgi:16S rRNA (cytosine967-C5)-methyltransferase